jgi:hypothetical protein
VSRYISGRRSRTRSKLHLDGTTPLPLGTKTPWGPIRAYAFTSGERYYWMSKERGDISMMPAGVVEAAVGKEIA